MAEATTVSAAGKINMHGVTSNPSVFTAQLPGVFSVAPSSAGYSTSLFQEYKNHNMKMVRISVHTGTKKRVPVRMLVLLSPCPPSIRAFIGTSLTSSAPY